MEARPGSKNGTSPRSSWRSLAWSTSMQTTSQPDSAKHTPATRPTYPVPTTATLTAGDLARQGHKGNRPRRALFGEELRAIHLELQAGLGELAERVLHHVRDHPGIVAAHAVDKLVERVEGGVHAGLEFADGHVAVLEVHRLAAADIAGFGNVDHVPSFRRIGDAILRELAARRRILRKQEPGKLTAEFRDALVGKSPV